MRKIILTGIILAGLIRLSGFLAASSSGTEIGEKAVETLAKNLIIPWDMLFLDSGEILITERPGSLVRAAPDGRILERTKLDGVYHSGEGGLHGIAAHPAFSANSLLYLYYTFSGQEGTFNRVTRYIYDENGLTEEKVILDNIPGGRIHNGGRIAFGPDGYLYVTAGDAGEADSAQDKDSLAGKILRITDEGGIPPDNPFDNEVYSYGHRNPQGMTWDKDGRLWATEHGPRARDELNMVVRGGNYGWPRIRGDSEEEGMIAPVINSGVSDTWAPAAAVYYEEKIFFAGLRGSAVYEYDTLSGELREHLKDACGRIRAVDIRGGYLYFTTSNRDGRGRVRKGDDRLLRIDIKLLAE